ncbi:MAG: energy transducer TonB [Acidobacteriota bacterium]
MLLIASSSASYQRVEVVEEVAHAVAERRLCDALASIGDGEQRTVSLSGIFVVGYDKMFKRKSGDWSPKRAEVRFTGELYGPGAIGPDDLSLLPPLANANRMRNRRYGHLNGYRTKFVVTAISDVKTVPDATPWPGSRSAASAPIVERAEVPRYPQLARSAGIAGEVVLDVTIRDGQVSKAEVMSGDRMLSEEAIRNVRTWQLTAKANTTFTTKYTYELEQRMTGACNFTRVELELPKSVRIIAPANGW